MSGIRSLFDGKYPKAILFDLDGTLVDSVPDLAAALDTALLACGHNAPGEPLARTWVGNGARVLVQRALAWAMTLDVSDVPEHQLDAALAQFFSAYEKNCAAHTRLYDGVLDCLNAWHQQGIAMACVTNKPERFTHPILAHFQLEDLLPVVLGGDSLPQRKPHPTPLQEALKRLDISTAETQQCLMVGDSRNDVEAARAAGMPVACVSYGYNHGEPVVNSRPDLLVDDFAALR